MIKEKFENDEKEGNITFHNNDVTVNKDTLIEEFKDFIKNEQNFINSEQ